MLTKRLVSTLGAASILALTGVSVSISGLSIHLIPVAQAASCDNTIRNVNFSGKAGNYPVNVRSDRSTSARLLRTLAPNTPLNFDAWGYGDTVTDIWLGTPDARWYKLRGENAWVASAVVLGDAPNSQPLPNCSGQFYQNPEAFFNWANGQRGISRLDTNDLQGQCVTLVARYIQEVKLPANERTIPRPYGDGKDTASVVANNSPFNRYFGAYTNSGLPSRGAVISFRAIQGNPYGHTGIVMEARNYNGLRQVKILESNWDNRGSNSTVRIGNWMNIDRDENGYGAANGWTNPK